MLSFFTIAFFLGMSHALEADHVAAVSAIASRQKHFSSIIRNGAVWGMGHTVTLMIFAGAALVLGLAINDQLAGWLEFLVGVMLIGLGAHIFIRLIRDRVHFHMHRHNNQAPPHFHAHSHLNQNIGTASLSHKHETVDHDHDHPRFPLRALYVGMMHGMAGSAALLILTASSTPSPLMGFIYVVLFGVGSILGMAALSAVIAVPIALTARFLTWANWGIQGITGLATIALGFHTLYVTKIMFMF